VQRDDDRDRAIDRALRESLGARVTASRETLAGEHIDGERLAAWTEGALRPDEAAIIERHLADCGQCQQLLVVFARTSPPPIATEPLWRRWRLQWLVPIATAATAVAIWVAAPRQQQAPRAVPSATATQAGERETDPNSTAATTAAPSQPATPSASLGETREKALSQSRFSDTDPLAKKETLERREQPADRVSALAQAPASPVPAAPPPPPGAAISRNADQAASAKTAREADEKPRGNQAVDTLTEAVQTAKPSAPSASAAGAIARAGRADVRAFSSRQTAAAIEIASPNASTRWLLEGRQVLHSANAGAAWQVATLPMTDVLTAGMSPAPSICWIVGRAGTVIVTSDGLRFTRLPFPEPIDLVSVTATDDRRATVTSADGRTFRTQDQGANWTR